MIAVIETKQTIVTIAATIIIVALIFNSFIKERFLLNDNEKKRLKQLEEQSPIKASGNTNAAIIWLLFSLLSLVLIYIFYNS